MTRLLLFGGSGQVGSALRAVLGPDAEVMAPSSSEVDFRHPADVEGCVADSGADVVVNLAAWTDVDAAEAEPAGARAVNAESAGAAARGAARIGARLVHVSTDYVFDGEGPWPYAPAFPPRPLNVYGVTKADGERRVLAACPGATVVRTSWVHSGGARNFVATSMGALLGGGDPMRVVVDQVSAPTRAAHLARAIVALAGDAGPGGIVHFTDAGVASRFDVACAVADILRRTGRLDDAAAGVVPVSTTDVPRPARRPRVSLLDARACWARLGWTPPHWRAGVEASVRERLGE